MTKRALARFLTPTIASKEGWRSRTRDLEWWTPALLDLSRWWTRRRSHGHSKNLPNEAKTWASLCLMAMCSAPRQGTGRRNPNSAKQNSLAGGAPLDSTASTAPPAPRFHDHHAHSPCLAELGLKHV